MGRRGKKKARGAGLGLGLGFPERTAGYRESNIVLNTDSVESLGDMTVIRLTGLQISTVKTKTFRSAQRFGCRVYPNLISVMRFLFRLFLHRKTSLKELILILG